MPLDTIKHTELERQFTLARIIFAVLALLALLAGSEARTSWAATTLISAYLLIVTAEVLADRFLNKSPFRMPLGVDLAVLAFVLCLTSSVGAVWFLLLCAVFILAGTGRAKVMVALIGVATIGVILRAAATDGLDRGGAWHWVAIGAGMLVSGLGMGLLAARGREYFVRQELLEKITAGLRFDRGVTESVRHTLSELAAAFECEQACMAIRDEDLDRLFVWKIQASDRESREPETLPLDRAESFLIDSLEVSLCWEFTGGDGRGFGWDRRTAERFRSIPAPPESTRDQFGARSLLAVTIEADGMPAGRVLLINPLPSRRKFSARDLRWLERIVRHVGPPLENVFMLRNLRSHAVESERSRISRDLHDGILQTLLSLKIQLEVLRKKLPQNPGEVCGELVGLQNIIQQESEELRRMVTDMRPLRMESADMRELMMGFAERMRSENSLDVDLFIEDRDLRLPNRLCRELFQIYRESLHNVKKHANASHVVVKLKQDEARVFLVVDDNGKGFSFSGRYTSEELDRLRLGPISIKERTRSVGGTLTVESNPGHGARLTVEIPIN